MVKLQAIRAGNSKLVNSQSLVAVVVGGTSGIGEFTLRALVSSHLAKGNGLCIYIVGRNAEAAKKIISDCTAKCPEGQYRFIQAMDLSLLQNVDKVAGEIIQHQQQNTSDSSGPRVDMLFMTQGGLYLTPRQGTLALLEDILTLLVAVTDLQSYRDTRRSRLRHVNALLLPRAFHFPAAPLAAVVDPPITRGIGLCGRQRSEAHP